MISIRKMVQTLMVVSCIAGLVGCGGGGGGGSAPTTPAAPAKATTTVSGKVDFPTLSNLVAKQVFLAEPINVSAYTLDGVLVGSAVADASGNFSISNLGSGVDYVLKATRGTQVMKKLIEKATVPPGVTVPNQDISGISTTAVVVASQKLAPAGITNFNLGEPVTLTEAQKTTMSSSIFSTVSPKDLETAITNAKSTVQAALTANDLSSLTSQLAELVNTLNLIVAAVSSNVDPTKVATGQVTSFDVAPNVLKPLEVTGGVVTQLPAVSSVSSTDVKATVTSSVAAYVPPSRVNLDVINNADAGTLYGITFELIVPTDATVKLDSNNKPLFLLAPGVTLSCLATASLQGNVLKVVIADVSPLPTGKLISFVFDKTAGVALTNVNFPLTYSKASDSTGNPLLNSFSLTSIVTSSGS